MPGRNISGESLVSHGRVNERRGCLDNSGKTEGASRAAFFLRSRLRLMPLAVARVDLHLCATIGLGDFESGHLAGQRGEGDRRANRQANESAQKRSHFSTLGSADPGRKRRSTAPIAAFSIRPTNDFGQQAVPDPFVNVMKIQSPTSKYAMALCALAVFSFTAQAAIQPSGAPGPTVLPPIRTPSDGNIRQIEPLPPIPAPVNSGTFIGTVMD